MRKQRTEGTRERSRAWPIGKTTPHPRRARPMPGKAQADAFPSRLRHWINHLLPTAGDSAQVAAWQLVRALLFGYTTCLNQLARQTERDTAAKITRQFFARWLVIGPTGSQT